LKNHFCRYDDEEYHARNRIQSEEGNVDPIQAPAACNPMFQHQAGSDLCSVARRRTIPHAMKRWLQRVVPVVALSFHGAFQIFGSDSEDVRWDFRFGYPGANLSTFAAVRFGGDLFVGGGFTAMGSAKAQFAARWDGQDWWSAGGGLESYPPSTTMIIGLATVDTNLFAALYDLSSNPAPAPRLLRWNGSVWSPFGGVTGVVYSVTADSSNLLVGGAFTLPGSTNIYGVARWDGTNWHTFDSRISGVVYFVVPRGEEVFVTGNFTSFGGQAISHNGRWNGTNWNALPGGAGGGSARPIILHQGELHMASYFYDTNGRYLPRIARFGGTNWTILGDSFNAMADHLASDGTNLYACGQFTNSGLVALNKLTVWNGTSWQPMGNPSWNQPGEIDPWRLAVDSDTGRVLALGYFDRAEGRPASCIAAWDGAQWMPLAPQYVRGAFGSIGSVWALCPAENSVFAGGLFNSLGQVTVNRIGRIDDTGCHPLGRGITNSGAERVFTLARQGTNLFAGGRFTTAGGKAIRNLACWDGDEWWPVGGGTDGDVYALAVDGGKLFVGGIFTNVGGLSIPNLACWDGTNWSALGTGVDGSVRALVHTNGLLYAGGTFTNAGGVTANAIAVWDGCQWKALGGGVAGTNRSIVALALSGTNLYAGGRFTAAGGVPANNIARWDGGAWSVLGQGVEHQISGAIVLAIAAREDVVYVGGNFTNAGGQPIRSLARWNGTNWSSLGSGIEAWFSSGPRVSSFALTEGSLYVGGLFSGAGGYAAANLARWVDRPQVRLNAPQTQPGGDVRLFLSGAGGLRLELETSGTLTNWVGVGNTRAISDEVEVVVPSGANQNFYRAMLLP